MRYVGGSPITEQEARSSVMAAPASTVMLEEEGTERSVQRTESLPMMGTSFPANVQLVPIVVVGVFFDRKQNPKCSRVQGFYTIVTLALKEEIRLTLKNISQFFYDLKSIFSFTFLILKFKIF
jgi:hypothetical protein